MSKLGTLLWYFYKPIALWNLAFSLFYIGLVIAYGQKIIAYSFYFKLLGYASTIFLQSYTAKNVYMYYRNAGHSVRRLYLYVFAIDMLLFVAAILLYLFIRHELLKS